MAEQRKTDDNPRATTARETRPAGGAQARRDPGSGVREQLRAAHEARTTVPGAPGVDARLDNRSGADRPPLETWPAKPQQIDGPDVMAQAEHTRRVLADRQGDDNTPRKGMFSPGPHGLSEEAVREPAGHDGQTLYGTESLTEAEVAKGAADGDKPNTPKAS